MITLLLAFALAPAPEHHIVMVSIDGFAAYSLKDPTVAVPNIRRLIAEGVAAEGMTPVNPTVTWPNHTSLVTGVAPARHSVLYNGQAQRTGEGKPLKVEPWVAKEELVASPTLYDAAYRAKLTTAEVDWVAIHKPRTITWAFPEVPSVDGPVEREMVAASRVTGAELAGFNKLPITYRDEIWTRAGEQLLTRHKPNLLLFHLLTTDSLQHGHGARSLAGKAALELADAKLGRLIEATRRAGIFEKTTFLIVSDHGFKTVRYQIQPNALFAANGLGDAVWSIPEGGTAMVYATRTQGKAEALARAQQLLRGVDGVARILTPDEFSGFGYPTPDQNARMADFVAAAADGYAFGGATTGAAVAPVAAGASPGTHGYLSTEPDMAAIFVASGRGIKKGSRLGMIRNVDVAPTAARLLGLTLDGVDGRVLTEILH